MRSVLDIVKSIGDKLIRETPFRYRLAVAPCNHNFINHSRGGMQVVDFGRTFGLGTPGVAYAFTQITVAEAQEIDLQIEHNDGCKIWVNQKVVYEKSGDRSIALVKDERSIEMTNHCTVTLQKGVNDLLIKSETRGPEWRFYLQPPSLKGAVVEQQTVPEIGLKHMPDIDPAVAALTNWLVLGPFENPVQDDQRCGLTQDHLSGDAVRIGTVYQGRDESIAWTIPKVEVLGCAVDPKEWGTNDMWNYHNGGVAWAMQHVARVANESKYYEYASRFCDYHLDSIPFIRYQVKTLNAVNSVNHYLIDTPLLDFTLAPSLPFIHRLRLEPEFNKSKEYETFIGKMLEFARSGQIRLPKHHIYTRTTPRQYTTWVDDMFMGIPFLVQASQYVSNPVQKKAFLDDAAQQIQGFKTQVWDDEAQLYMHVRFSDSDVKSPHWSRCNGWALWAMAEVLDVLPEDHDCHSEILMQFRRHSASLLRLQNQRGFWYNVLDREDSKEEVSGTAIFVMAYARGVNRGWLKKDPYQEAALKGWQAVASRVEDDGTVHDICMGTMCSEKEEHYMSRPFYDNDTHGLFAVLFAGIAIHDLEQSGIDIGLIQKVSIRPLQGKKTVGSADSVPVVETRRKNSWPPLTGSRKELKS